MSGELDRRAFLLSGPRYVLNRLRPLMASLQLERTTEMNGHQPSASRRVAMVDVSHCVAWDGGSCQLCYLRCPLRGRAIVQDDGKPVIVASVCDGCGVCVEACRAVNDLGAIHIVNV